MLYLRFTTDTNSGSLRVTPSAASYDLQWLTSFSKLFVKIYIFFGQVTSVTSDQTTLGQIQY